MFMHWQSFVHLFLKIDAQKIASKGDWDQVSEQPPVLMCNQHKFSFPATTPTAGVGVVAGKKSSNPSLQKHLWPAGRLHTRW